MLPFFYLFESIVYFGTTKKALGLILSIMRAMNTILNTTFLNQ
nr:MAG TPA: hypothetical protein [Caudoviricetes sp.]